MEVEFGYFLVVICFGTSIEGVRCFQFYRLPFS